MYLLDTNVCVGFLKGNADIAFRFGQHTPTQLHLCAVVKAEMYFGARASQQIAKNLATLEAFFKLYLSLPFDDDCSRIYGQLRADLKRIGRPIGPNDLMIASIALRHDLTLVTHNTREFAQVPGLRLEDWLAP